MHWKKHSLALSSAVAAALLLSACGGGNNGSGNQPPPAAQGDTFAVMGNNLVTFNRATPGTIATSTPINGVTAGETILGGDIRPSDGNYYVLTSAPAVYLVSRATGLASNRVALTSAGAPLSLDTTVGATFGVDFNPVPDRMRITSSGNGQNLRVNVADGTTTVDTNLTVAAAAVGASEVAYTNNFNNTCRTTLFYIDTNGATDRLLTTTNPNGGVLTAVGPLGVDASGASGFEIISTTDGTTTTNAAIAALTVAGTTQLYNINLTTGAATAVTGNFTGQVVGLSVVPGTTGPANAVGDLVAVNTSNNIISFNAAAPGKLCTTAPITAAAGTTLATNEAFLDLDVRPKDGLLYGVSSASKIYTIAPTTGVATLVSTIATPLDPAALASGSFGIDFNPVPDRLRIVSSTGQNLRVNVVDGTTTVDGVINGQTDASITAVGYTNSIDGATQTKLFDIDVANDTLVLQNPPNNGTLSNPIPLGVDVQTAAGFDVNGRTNQAFAAFNIAGASASVLYTVNLAATASPAAALATTPNAANNIGGGAPIRGLALSSAVTQASKATVVAVTGDGNVVTFDPRTPGTFATSVAITGLQGGDSILGIDQRPSNKLIYAVTAFGQLYTLNQTTGVATPAGSVSGALTADATDTTNPFTALAGNLFGVDVNPVPDRLRVVSNFQQNLRINMDTAGTITDTDLTRVVSTPPDVNAAITAAIADVAYSNNFAGATTTTLFGLDTGTAQSLVRFQANANATPPITPNNGILVTVGSFSNATTPLPAGAIAPATTTFTSVGGFDTFGGDAATIAVLQPDIGLPVGAQSQLYIVNLTTGALTAQPLPAAGSNVIGPAATVIVAATVFLP